MGRMIFVNLPVENLPRTMEFWKALGFEFNPQFTDDKAASLIISENIFAMLLTKEFFKTFIKKEIADAKQSTEVLVCLSCSSRQEVDDLVRKAVAAGGSIAREAKDHGFMYEHAFEDLDGHIWELAYMEPNGQG
jgi:uncharacterized protein